MTSQVKRNLFESELPPPHDANGQNDSSRDSFASAEVNCWRCDKSYDQNLLQCPACLATNRTLNGSDQDKSPPPQTPAIIDVIWAYIAILAVTLICASCAAFSQEFIRLDVISLANQILGWMSVSGIFIALILIIAMRKIHTDDKVLPQPRNPALAWFLSLPLLAVVLVINHGYHSFLLEPPVEQELTVSFADHWLAMTLIVCLWPAVVEELFFRNLALKACIEVLSSTQTVMITSLMFALAHLGQPLSLPILTLIGLILGYLRITSGSLMLPMVFHFLHNLTVLSWKGTL